jgi:hypothetical protein
MVSNLFRFVLNTLILIVGIAVLMMTWQFVGAANDGAMKMLLSQGEFGGPVLDILGMVWLGVRILFWLFVALGVTVIVLLVLAVTGVLAWFLKQIGVGLGYLVGFVRSQYASTVDTDNRAPGATAGALVVGEDDDGPVTLMQCLREFAQQIDDFETHIDEINERIETLEGRNVQNTVV